MTAGASPPPRVVAVDRLMIGVVAVATGLARWLTSRGRYVYTLWPDEPAQLAIARLVGGHGERWNMWNHSTWRPAYGTLLGLVTWFTDDPRTIFRTGLVLNAVLGAVAAVLAYRLTRRLTTVGPVAAAVVTVLVLAAPSMLFTTNFLWSESLAQPLYLATLLVLVRFWERPSVATGCAAGVLAVAGFGTHSRLLPLAVVVVVVIVVAAVRSRLVWWEAGVAVAVTVASFALVTWYSEWIIDQLWNEPLSRNSYGGVASQLGKLPLMFVALVGQSWYQLVTTLGLVGLGVAGLAVSARRRVDARIVAGSAAALVALSVLFMTDRWRSDQIVYGRYNDLALIPVLLVGVAALVTLTRASLVRRWAVTAGLTVVAGVVLHLLRHEQLAARDGVRQMVLGLLAFMGRPQGIEVLPITFAAVALGAAVVVTVAARALAPSWGRYAGLAAVAVMVTIGYVRADSVVDGTRNAWRTSASLAELDESVLTPGARIDYVLPATSTQTSRMMSYQFFLPDHRFEIVSAPDLTGRRARYVFAASDTAALRTAGATAIWTDPRRPITLWSLPTD